MKKQKYIYLLALLPFLAVAVLYEIVPLCSVIGNSFIPDGGSGFSLENYEKIFTKQQPENITDVFPDRHYHCISGGESNT